jgi:hypothetical protein
MITALQYEQMQARCVAGRGEAVPGDAVELEGGLHDDILAECRRRLWPVVHSRMDAATTTAKGVTDFIIPADRGMTFYIEAKTRTAKLTTEQLGFKAMVQRNGHKYAVVRNMAEFLGAVETWLNQ